MNRSNQDVEKRTRDRYRRAGLTSLGNVAARGATFLVTLVTIPITSRYLGPELFGLWMIVNSLTALLAFTDFGMGNGLLNAVAMANGTGDVRRIRAAISSGVLVLSIVSILFLLTSLPLVSTVNWGHVFRLRDAQSVRAASDSLSVFCVCTALNIPLGITARVQLGIQKGFLAALWQISGSFLGAILMLAVVWSKGSLPWIVAAVLGAPLLAAAANTIMFFWSNRPDLKPCRALVSKSQVIWIAQLGGMFFVLQLVGALAFSSDNVIAARIVGAAAVGDYAIASSLFAVCATALSAILQPLWPAYSEAIGRRDFAWVWNTLVRSTLFATCAAVIFSVAMLVLFKYLTAHWLHRVLNVSGVLLVGLALWAVIQTMGTSLAMFLNGAHVVRLQMMLSAPFATSCIGLKIILVSKFGVVGLPWAAILSYVPISLIPVLVVTRKLVLNLQEPSVLASEVKNTGSS